MEFEMLLLLQAQVCALTRLLVEGGIFTEAEMQSALDDALEDATGGDVLDGDE